eukprot:TRINITY_DN739_c0_g1_i1.p1 TRINITY_DN739_c0_g1~~TRINITY_DN739_c0_g1_i1.p1  ORF type:complete len:850 (-),score=164.87 TRINITY_DN739_c0_g1_i1:58-2607(-)
MSTSIPSLTQSMKKIYVHYEGEPDFTYLAKISDSNFNFAQLKSQFCSAFNEEHSSIKVLTPNNINIVNETKRVFKDIDSVFDTLKDKQDTYVVEVAVTPVLTRTPEQIAQASQLLKDEGNKFMEKKQFEKAIEKYTEAISLDPSQPTYYGNRSQAYLNSKKYMEAVEDATRCILLDKNNAKAYFRKGCALFYMDKFSEAIECFKTAKTLPNVPPQSLADFNMWIKKSEVGLSQVKTTEEPATLNGSEDPLEVHEYLNQAHIIAKESEKKSNYRHAIFVYEQCLKASPSDKKAYIGIGDLYMKAYKYDVAIKYYSQGLSYYRNDIELLIRLGDAHYTSGSYQVAGKLFGTALELTKMIPALGPKINEVKVKLGQVMYALNAQPSAVEIFKEVLESTKMEDPLSLYAYGLAMLDHSPSDALPIFLKLLVKDQNNAKYREKLCESVRSEGGFDALMEELSTIPQSHSALSYLASVVKEFGALEASSKLYKSALQLLPTSTSYALNYVHVLEILNQYEDAFTFIKEFFMRNKNFGLSHLSCAQVYNVIKDYSDIRTKLENPPSALEVPSRQSKPLDQDYNTEELDLLALLCTLVKILYVKGNMSLIKPLADLINPTREGRQMHTTTIRNEHAYFCCIDQLMTYHDMSISLDKPIIYLAGDSHALVTAWMPIKFKGEDHVIKPLLVTGLKCWHLRPESNFYPKYNFWNIVPQAPIGSHVIFQFGEIDCREGFVKAVQKCIYEDIAEGCRTVIDIYIKVLLEIKEKYKYHIYVHPPTPVIDVTRDIVKTFNDVLREKVKATPGLHYLEFFDQLLTDDKKNLHPDYVLDGTHMNPRYLFLIENELSKIESNKDQDA